MTLVDVARLHGHGLLGSVDEGQSGGQWLPKAGGTVLDDDEVAVGPRSVSYTHLTLPTKVSV